MNSLPYLCLGIFCARERFWRLRPAPCNLPGDLLSSLAGVGHRAAPSQSSPLPVHSPPCPSSVCCDRPLLRPSTSLSSRTGSMSSRAARPRPLPSPPLLCLLRWVAAAPLLCPSKLPSLSRAVLWLWLCVAIVRKNCRASLSFRVSVVSRF